MILQKQKLPASPVLIIQIHFSCVLPHLSIKKNRELKQNHSAHHLPCFLKLSTKEEENKNKKESDGE